MQRYCYRCGTGHDIRTRCPTSSTWTGSKVGRLRKLIYRRDRGICQECGQPVTYADFHVDHITPRSMGGTDDMTNLRCTCSTCNLQKGAA